MARNREKQRANRKKYKGGNPYRNAEKYYDPTAGKAITTVMKKNGGK